MISMRTVEEMAGGKRQLAEACRVSRQAIGKWKRVPAAHLITVERLTGIDRARLRPDLAAIFKEAAE